MKYSRIAVLVALASVATACSPKQTPVPLVVTSGSVAALVGDWAGEYSSTETGRSGSIMFQLSSVGDTAHGDVVMVPRMRALQVPAQERQPIAADARALPEPLTIRFVQLDGGRVSGSLAPYADPACGCTVNTTYEGRFTDADTIEGTYRTLGVRPGHEPTAGRWKVTRQRPKVTIR